MLSPDQSLARIVELIGQALATEDPRDARGILIQAQTHAMLQRAALRKAEARVAYAARLEEGVVLQ